MNYYIINKNYIIIKILIFLNHNLAYYKNTYTYKHLYYSNSEISKDLPSYSVRIQILLIIIYYRNNEHCQIIIKSNDIIIINNTYLNIIHSILNVS